MVALNAPGEGHVCEGGDKCMLRCKKIYLLEE